MSSSFPLGQAQNGWAQLAALSNSVQPPATYGGASGQLAHSIPTITSSSLPIQQWSAQSSEYGAHLVTYSQGATAIPIPLALRQRYPGRMGTPIDTPQHARSSSVQYPRYMSPAEIGTLVPPRPSSTNPSSALLAKYRAAVSSQDALRTAMNTPRQEPASVAASSTSTLLPLHGPIFANTYTPQLNEEYIQIPEVKYAAELEACLQPSQMPPRDDSWPIAARLLSFVFDPAQGLLNQGLYLSTVAKAGPQTSEQQKGPGPFASVMYPQRLYLLEDYPSLPVTKTCTGCAHSGINTGSESTRASPLIQDRCVRWEPWYYVCRFCITSLD